MKSAKERRRRVLIYPDPESDYWIAECPSLPGCFSQGESREQALANIRDAIVLYLEVLEEDGRAVPEEHYETVMVSV